MCPSDASSGAGTARIVVTTSSSVVVELDVLDVDGAAVVEGVAPSELDEQAPAETAITTIAAHSVGGILMRSDSLGRRVIRPKIPTSLMRARCRSDRLDCPFTTEVTPSEQTHRGFLDRDVELPETMYDHGFRAIPLQDEAAGCVLVESTGVGFDLVHPRDVRVSITHHLPR